MCLRRFIEPKCWDSTICCPCIATNSSDTLSTFQSLYFVIFTWVKKLNQYFYTSTSICTPACAHYCSRNKQWTFQLVRKIKRWYLESTFDCWETNLQRSWVRTAAHQNNIMNMSARNSNYGQKKQLLICNCNCVIKKKGGQRVPEVITNLRKVYFASLILWFCKLAWQ